MATLSLTFNACGGSSTSQKIYYGKTGLVTGNALTGTGWTLWTGAPLAANITSANITPVDDNVDYSVERYCNCPNSGDTGPERKDKLVKNVCGTFSTLVSSSNTISYEVTLPASLNNAGVWANKIQVELTNAQQTQILQTHVINKPFPSVYSGNFQGLMASSNYAVRMKHVDSTGTRNHVCQGVAVSTKAACSAPTVTLSNVTPTSMQINWSVPNAVAGDSYNIIRNGSTIASGLPLSASPYTLTGLTQNTLYQITIMRNCGSGGSVSGTASDYTTNAPSLVQSCTDIHHGVKDQCFTVGSSVATGNRFTLTLFGKTVTYIAQDGDNRYDIAQFLAEAFEAIPKSEWEAAPDAPTVDFLKPFATNGNPPGNTIYTRVNEEYTVTAAAYHS